MAAPVAPGTAGRVITVPGRGGARSLFRHPARRRLAEAAWGSGVVLLAALACVPFLYTCIPVDEGIWLGAAMKLSAGQRLYADIFEFLPPLSFLVTAGWLGAFGTTLVAARCLTALLVAGTAGLTFLSCRRSGASRPVAASCALLWVVCSQGDWTQLNHHWMTTFLSMAAAWAALSTVGAGHPCRRWAWAAGLAAGTAAMVTPHSGGLVGLACLAVFGSGRHRAREAGSFLLGGATVPLAMLAYLGAEGVLPDAFQDVIVHTVTQYSSIQHLPYGAFTEVQSLPMAVAPPLSVAFILLLLAREAKAMARDRVLLGCAAFALSGVLVLYPRADRAHLGFVLPLVLPLAAYGLTGLLRQAPAVVRRATVCVLAAACLPSAAQFGLLAAHDARLATAETPAGRVAFIDNGGETQAIIGRLASLPAADRVFFYPYSPMLPFLTGRQQVSRFDLMTPSYTTPAQFEEICRSVTAGADWVVFDHFWADPQQLRLIYPSIPDASPPEVRRFEAILAAGFEPHARQGRYELRKRSPGAPAGGCDGLSAARPG